MTLFITCSTTPMSKVNDSKENKTVLFPKIIFPGRFDPKFSSVLKMERELRENQVLVNLVCRIMCVVLCFFCFCFFVLHCAILSCPCLCSFVLSCFLCSVDIRLLCSCFLFCCYVLFFLLSRTRFFLTRSFCVTLIKFWTLPRRLQVLS